MTREHKLAIILGFSVLLVVGLLVGDHFSKARRPQGSEVTLVPVEPTSSPTPAIVEPTSPSSGRSDLAGVPATPGRDSLTVVEPSGRATVEPIVMGRPREALASSTTPPASPNLTGPSTNPNDLTDLRRRLDSFAQTPATPDSGVPSPSGNGNALTSTPPTPTTPDRMHPVQEGQTLYSIAKQYYGDGNLWKDLAKYNEGRVKGDALRVGVTLKIPTKDVLLGRTPSAPANPTTTTSTPRPTTPGPTRVTGSPALPSSAPAGPTFGAPLTSVETTGPTSGKPEVAPKPEAAKPSTYTVKSGDTLMHIAEKTLGSSKRWQDLMAANKNQLDEPEDLRVGMVLKIPGK